MMTANRNDQLGRTTSPWSTALKVLCAIMAITGSAWPNQAGSLRPDFDKQIVPKLADYGIYLASESTIYRLLFANDLMRHRGRCKLREAREVQEYEVTGPNLVWSWDITYLRTEVRGSFYYLYLFLDVWSRKGVAAEVYDVECGELAKELCARGIANECADPRGLVLHQDNGAPMKNASFKAKLEHMGVKLSYSRPSVSDDNPYSEAAFRTANYCPMYPKKPFKSLEEARAWARKFVDWYNNEHLHSGIGFVSPQSRHEGTASKQLAQRRRVYAAAQARHPERFANGTRAWDEPDVVWLNPSKVTRELLRQDARAA
jgi:putative transposase